MNWCKAAAPGLAALFLLSTASATRAQEDLPVPEADLSVEPRNTALTIASWGGAYTESQSRAYFGPFEEKTGIAIEVVTHDGDPATLTSGAEDAGAKDWDVIDMDTAALEQACREGLLQTIDPDELAPAPDGTAPGKDFLPGTLHDCGVGSAAWSSVIAYDKTIYEETAPDSLSDFFDPERFPGKRALPDGPRYTLELALMADGVAPEHVYRLLETDAGVEQAFRVLDRIRDETIWWESTDEPLKLLGEGAAAMAVAYNGRAFSEIVGENSPFGLIWEGQVYDIELWAIPKSSTRKDAALKFIRFATGPERMARQTHWFPYGPVRRSALEHVGKHAEVNVQMSDFIPTARDNFRRALRLDPGWWRDHEAALQERFETWRSQAVSQEATGALPEGEEAGADP